MEIGLLHTHNLLRWLILISILAAIVLAYSGWAGKKQWSKADNLAGLILTISVDLQLLAGLVLYFFYSPMVEAAFANFGAAMKQPQLRFYSVEHIFIMVLAIVVIHIGRVKVKKASLSVQKHRLSAIYYSVALILILAGIPWTRAIF